MLFKTTDKRIIRDYSDDKIVKIYLKGIGTVYPDFTFLSRKIEKEIYWEHCGRTDDPEYARKMVRKINMYENNEIFPGDRLIITYETEQVILNTGKIKQLVERYL